MVSEAQKRAKNKYDSAHYTIVGCKIKKEYAADFRTACEQSGTSPNAVLRAAVDDFVSKHPIKSPGG